ncbi:MAG TPA: TIGR00374 family protein [Bacteroidales bacterium]|jgi:glycosyltransferase 2 family protein|nr:TIGR00374 family protein [Bacteroidales bacterium]HBZ22362.1 TIGR00374 family protein [Bacteroidales bacterium]
MSTDNHYKLVSRLKPGRIVIPILIGLAVVGWFILKEINTDALSLLNFTWRSLFWLLVAWLCMIGRDLGYMIRIRILSENDLNWRQAFRVIMLWEFTSAITPSTVGGTAVAVVFIHKEGISVGRSTSIVLATSFLDELYFVIMFPLILMIVGGDILFTTSLHGTGIALLNNLFFVAVAGYLIILAWVLFVGYGLFIDPEKIKKTILWFFRLPFLKRWKESAVKAGDDIVESSYELKRKPFVFWVRAFTATFLSWTSRYWVVNAILVAFFAIHDHFLIFARQLVTWIMMIISPTPGGSGFAELILGRYISDAIPADALYVGSLALAIAIIWRIISYYPYLIIGASIVPGWIQRNFVKPRTKKI